jgi:predicted nucleic acid-binding protein
MKTFWDTSAVLALVFKEQYSGTAEHAASLSREVYGWCWMEVEARCAFRRRGGNTKQEETLRRVLSQFHLLDLERERKQKLLDFNLVHRLRAADAAHLFCFRELCAVVEGLTLVSFDSEMLQAARNEKLGVFSP